MEEASELLREGTILNSTRESKTTGSTPPLDFNETAEPSMVVPFDEGY
jgi:hypothetical protein